MARRSRRHLHRRPRTNRLDWWACPGSRPCVPAGPNRRRTATATLYPGTTQRVRRKPTVVDYVNIRWTDDWCKRCNICVEICPKDSLVLTHDAIIEVEDCIRCGLCERYCPDMAIAVLAEARVVGLASSADVGAAAGLSGALSIRPSARPSVSIPDVARGPAVAGTNPVRGISDAESEHDVERANPT
jgi:NAD-dependent dihydropyrimidine dehydrogenase PreA subunit